MGVRIPSCGELNMTVAVHVAAFVVVALIVEMGVVSTAVDHAGVLVPAVVYVLQTLLLVHVHLLV